MKHAAALALLAALTVASPARAQSSTDEAKQLFQEGASAYTEARYEDAIEAFTKAYDLDPKPALLYNVAQAYERLGDVPNALRAYRDYLRSGPAEADREIVQTRIRNLEQRLRARGLQQVSVFSTPAGADVIVDDEKVGKTPWTGELEPGRHVVVLAHPDFPKVQKEFVLGKDRSIDLDIALGAGATTSSAAVRESPEAPAPAPAEATRDGGGPGKVAPWTWATLGVGVAALGGALGFELARRGAEDDARSEVTQIGHHRDYQHMKDLQRNARIFIGIGAAATAAGGVLLVLDLTGGADAPSEKTARVGPGCADGLCGLHAEGSF